MRSEPWQFPGKSKGSVGHGVYLQMPCRTQPRSSQWFPSPGAVLECGADAAFCAQGGTESGVRAALQNQNRPCTWKPLVRERCAAAVRLLFKTGSLIEWSS